MAHVNRLKLDKNTSVIAARLVGDSGALDAAAKIVAEKVRTRATAIKDEGDFAQSVKIDKDRGPKKVMDRVVYSDDPGALSIEYGHRTKSGVEVEGKHVFTDTYDDAHQHSKWVWE